MSGGKAQTVIDSGAVWARFVPSGHIVYSGRGKLFALPFDLESLHYRWKGVPVTDATRSKDWEFSSNGTLV